MYLVLIGITTITSCNKGCQTGYENPNCSIETRAPFENLNYTVTESRNQDSAYTYAATIIPDPHDITKVQLTNVANGRFVNNVSATTRADTLFIPVQSPDTNTVYIQGLGIIQGNVLVMSFAISYSIRQYQQTDVYQSTWTYP